MDVCDPVLDALNQSGGGEALHEILGYLNFSEGASDSRWMSNINEVFRRMDQVGQKDSGRSGDSSDHQKKHWETFFSLLAWKLNQLRGQSSTFRDADQAEAVLRLAGEHVLPAYLEFHRDLLFHQSAASLFQPLFLGRVFEMILLQGPPWNQSERITDGSIAGLNDFIGYRPVAVLVGDEYHGFNR